MIALNAPNTAASVWGKMRTQTEKMPPTWIEYRVRAVSSPHVKFSASKLRVYATKLAVPIAPYLQVHIGRSIQGMRARGASFVA